jgi:hypothetical protein
MSAGFPRRTTTITACGNLCPSDHRSACLPIPDFSFEKSSFFRGTKLKKVLSRDILYDLEFIQKHDRPSQIPNPKQEKT